MVEGIYANADVAEDNNDGQQKSESSVTGIKFSENKKYRLTAVCVLLLCVLLLSAIAVLWIKFNNMTTERNEFQTGYNFLIKETDELKKQKDVFQKKLTDLGWRFSTLKFYYVSTQKKNWTESRQDCIERGLDLVIINSKEEQEFVNNLSKIKNYGVYIGLTDQDKEGVWKWVDGTSMTKAYWASGNKHSKNDDCVVNKYKSGGWFDRPCTETYHWICE
ncbi:CD209 antigen-like protein E [Clarias gariepinus]|uniref:CD209 antigen-like protein E n=1 Tax=Clarias gariepinus TaxID=13013 RepID=UPI00234D8500|nr:CD209 antigen-like protein E [Clarias gariepinus]